MKVKWLGHAAFLITADNDLKIIMDPYALSERLHYGQIDEAADIVTTSHQHSDHNNSAAVRGNPEVVKDTGTASVRGIEIKGVPSYHDDNAGAQRGPNTVFCLNVDGIRLCHLGDLGQQLTASQISEIGEVDVLLSPMAGGYTIDAATATGLINKLKPRVTIPMHFRNSQCDYPVTGVDEFLRDKNNVTILDSSETDFKKGALPENQIIVLQPAL
jgi:L-ascorbate metabolism protein UlaG (beta-lactamase superfamily)